MHVWVGPVVVEIEVEREQLVEADVFGGSDEFPGVGAVWEGQCIYWLVCGLLQPLPAFLSSAVASASGIWARSVW
ncbi:hypothetical protein ACQ86N_32885 [Puia sp. P3]|uniref:hypothetical protein n=1 Tax=Puia sp. P3 TaxID=3423952 RepID=UPI003D667D91